MGLLLLALAKKSEDLTRASFAVFFAIALMSLPTYMTGYPAEKALVLVVSGGISGSLRGLRFPFLSFPHVALVLEQLDLRLYSPI